ncbi:hypothetical protein [Streptomyces spectabilis]|uniref:Uncharacterized protein n=1 Tax=Streptomyces spectabilis TaxID=68270 RepID=A0A7W8B6K3_STRST|nr:hypothetical protein [Streptomyces spectabilis]MBB5110105.1 hypothetical protein [Streptomyces spectabilis]GGV58558.1 hypothetical protein GCM10010245_91650 [Streptomyces spectabilis]
MGKIYSIAGVAFALVITLVGTATSASAVNDSRPGRSQSPSGVAAQRAADQFDIWRGLSERQWLEALEEGCIKTGSPACKMTQQQAGKLLSDTRQLTQKLHQEIMSNPAEVAELKSARQQRTRAATASAARVAAIISKYSKSPAVKKLDKYSAKIGDIAGHVNNATFAVNGLTEGTAESISRAIVYMVPVVGDVWSLGEGIANGDVESGAVAVVSLIATAAAAVLPPAGAVLAAAVAAYSVAKMIIGFLCSKDRDWEAEPPGTPKELFESGADIRWETRRVAGKDVAAIIPPNRSVTQTLLLDSKWTKYNAGRQPVKYSLSKGYLMMDGPAEAKRLTVWQAGRQAGNGDCDIAPEEMGPGLFCSLNSTAVISLNHPAIIVIEYDFPEKNPCSGTPCVPAQRTRSILTVHSEGKKPVHLNLPFHYAFISSLSEVYADGDFRYFFQEEGRDEDGEPIFYTNSASVPRPEHGKCYNLPPATKVVENSTRQKATVWYGRDCRASNSITVPAGEQVQVQAFTGNEFGSFLVD